MRKKTPEYIVWDRMKSRCYNPNNVSFKYYGGAGVTVCDKWKNSFDAFLADVGERPTKSHSLDRYPDKNGNYEPGNVRWASPKEQQSNRSDNVIIEVFGEKKIKSEWCQIFGISKSTLETRLNNGWPIERALTKPPMKRKSNRNHFFFNHNGIKGHAAFDKKPDEKTMTAFFEMIKLAYSNTTEADSSNANGTQK